MSFYKLFSLGFLLVVGHLGWCQNLTEVHSPDQNLKVTVGQTTKEGLFYKVDYRGETFIEKSPLGLHTSLGEFKDNLDFINSKESLISEEYKLDRGKKREITYKANEVTVTFINPKKDTLQVIFRVSDYNVGYSYRLKPRDNDIKMTHIYKGIFRI